jgi:SAM-dependent methyltransferase
MAALSTKILPDSVLNAVKHCRPVYAAGRRLRFAVGAQLGARSVPGIAGRVHFNDFMLTSLSPEDVEGYRGGARQFVNILGRSLNEAGRSWSDVEAALDIGCGYGRIVRELLVKLPADRIYVNDLNDQGASFTAREFGVHKMPLIEQAGSEWNGRFDLIYLCTVYTNIRRDAIVANLHRVQEALKPGGVLVFTMQGQGSADTAERYEQYWLDKAKVQEGLRREGYYFERYPYYYVVYGLAWFNRPAVEAVVAEAAPDLRAISFRAMEMDEHQDVYVYQKPM